MNPIHIPVLQKQVLKYLNPEPNNNIIDCTFGAGGYSRAILEKIKPKGKILAIEWDKEILKYTEPCERIILVNDSYVNLEKIVREQNFEPSEAILFDLGISSWHIEHSKRGFSFNRNELLIMRYNWEKEDELTAAKIINFWPESEIQTILTEYGNEKFARKIAKKIIQQRQKQPIKTTFQLVRLIEQATPAWYHRKKIHFATKTFQALRIAVNNELNNIKKTLHQALKILETNGRLVVISFHSLEDKIIKNFLKDNSAKGLLKIITKKPIVPADNEVKLNPGSRSAKLRAAVKL